MSTPTLSESCVCGANITVTSPDATECRTRVAGFVDDHATCTAYDATYDGRTTNDKPWQDDDDRDQDHPEDGA